MTPTSPSTKIRTGDVVRSKLLPQRPDAAAARNKPIALEGYARVAVQPIRAGVLDSQLHFVSAGLAVGLDQNRQDECRTVRGENPVATLVSGRHVRALKHADTPAVRDSGSRGLGKGVVAAVDPAGRATEPAAGLIGTGAGQAGGTLRAEGTAGRRKITKTTYSGRE